MPFKIDDKVRLNTKHPNFSYTYKETLSEVGTITEQPTLGEWYVDFPSYSGFRVLDSELELVSEGSMITKGTTLKVPPHPQSVTLRIVEGRPPDVPKPCHSTPQPTPNDKTDEVILQWKLDKSLHLETLAADFYTLTDLQCDYPKEPQITKPLKRLTTLLADQFSAYLDMVIGGELRHTWEFTIGGYDEDDSEIPYASIDDMPLSETAKDILKSFTDYGGYAGRNYVWRQWRDIREKLGIKALNDAIQIFNLDWEGGYGGESWANATRILIDYLNGDLSATAFVDTCFGLHHNNNIILDKVWQISKYLQSILGYNCDNRMRAVAEHCSPKVKKLVRRFRK